jgi:hypothetical protein
MILSKKSGMKRPQIDETSAERKFQEKAPEITEKEIHREQRILHKIEKEYFTVNILAESGYKTLTRITNLGWQKAQTKSRTHLSPSLTKSTPK